MTKVLIKTVIMLLMLVTLTSCNFIPHETEGRYLVNQINSDNNRNKSDESYFYADNYNIYRYSFSQDETEICVRLDKEDGYFIKNYAVYEEKIYYIKSNGNMYELCCRNYISDSEEVLLSNNDMAQFNEGKQLGTYEYPAVDAYGGYLFFAIVEKYEYMCPIEGDIKTDSIHLNSLFESEGQSGDIQRAVYDGIVIERYVVSDGKYEIRSIKDIQGYKILYLNIEPSIGVDDKQIRFYKNWKTGDIWYQVDESVLRNIVSIFRGDEYKNSHINEDYLTIEDGKIIGVLSVSRHWAEYKYLDQYNLDRDVLFELDIETGESRILLDTKNNLTKIIGYQNGLVYLVKNEKVYSYELETKEKTELFDLPKGKNYIIDWQVDYLIIREEFFGEQNGDIIAVYQL